MGDFDRLIKTLSKDGKMLISFDNKPEPISVERELTAYFDSSPTSIDFNLKETKTAISIDSKYHMTGMFVKILRDGLGFARLWEDKRRSIAELYAIREPVIAALTKVAIKYSKENGKKLEIGTGWLRSDGTGCSLHYSSGERTFYIDEFTEGAFGEDRYIVGMGKSRILIAHCEPPDLNCECYCHPIFKIAKKYLKGHIKEIK